MNLRVSKIVSFCVVLAGLVRPGQAAGQSPVPTIPLSQQNKIFNAVTTPQTSGCLANQGQNIWISNYSVVGGAATVQYRLEYSYNSDSATCTTGTWFAMSDDATGQNQGEVVGIGSYPFVRANLVVLITSFPVTAFYTTSSASPSNLSGFYNPSQQIRKVAFSNQDATTNPAAVTVACPFGTSQALLFIIPSGATFSGAASVSVTSTEGLASFPRGTLNLAGNNPQALFVPATGCTNLSVAYSHGTTAAGVLFGYLIFVSPGSAVSSGQPPLNKNSESISGANAAVNVTISPVLSGGRDQSVYVYSVSARCSAGTAQLTITDQNTSTQIWSTGTTEVGTTSFVRAWNPGLLGSLNVADSVIVSLGACGAANTGTLDVQASIF
jgi:hypothetical protein